MSEDILPSVGSCPSASELADPAGAGARLDEHVAVCADCRTLLGDLARLATADAAVEEETSRNDLIDARFFLGPRVASGGMGVVHRGFDLVAERRVAIKLLRATGEDARFTREWAALRSLDHPDVVSYVAHGSASDGRRYLVTEWLEGETLRAHLHRVGRLLRTDAIALVLRIADALAAAHGAGLVHRDIKPANVFLVANDLARPKILDFGLVLPPIERDGRVTASGECVGTPGYMSPEQARGLREVDARADVYAIGCVLYRCVAGVAPFEGPDALTILLKTAYGPRPDFGALDPPLGALLATMLAISPADRPRDAADLARRLRLLDG